MEKNDEQEDKTPTERPSRYEIAITEWSKLGINSTTLKTVVVSGYKYDIERKKDCAGRMVTIITIQEESP